MRRFLSLALVVLGFALPARAADVDPDFAKLVPTGAKVEKLAGGMTFTEGPVWVGEYLIFSDIPSNRLMKWQKKGGLTVFRKDSNAANGNARDTQGRLITCEHSARRVTRTDAGSTRARVLIDKYNGKKFKSPNDLAGETEGADLVPQPPHGVWGKWKGEARD